MDLKSTWDSKMHYNVFTTRIHDFYPVLPMGKTYPFTHFHPVLPNRFYPVGKTYHANPAESPWVSLACRLLERPDDLAGERPWSLVLVYWLLWSVHVAELWKELCKVVGENIRWTTAEDFEIKCCIMSNQDCMMLSPVMTRLRRSAWRLCRSAWVGFSVCP